MRWLFWRQVAPRFTGEKALSRAGATKLADLIAGRMPADRFKSEEVADILRMPMPSLLRPVAADDELRIRYAAALDLMGVRNAARSALPELYRSSRGHDRDTTVRMMVFAMWHRRTIRRMADAEISHARIISITDGSGCPECAKINGAAAELRALPELPYPRCTCLEGCRCRVLAMLEEHGG